MTAALTREAVTLHPVEVDLLCAFAETAAPFPLDIPSVGVTDQERTLLFGAAREQLVARRLAGSRGPVGPAGTFVRMVRSGAGAVDLVVADGERSLGAVALVDGLRGLLMTQSPDEPGQPVRLTELGVDDAMRELLALVPAVEAASVPPFTLPLRPVRHAFERIIGGQHQLTDAELDELLAESGMDDPHATRLVTNLRQVFGSGQVGATRWDRMRGRWQRLGDEVHWIDTNRGRFRLATDTDEVWASVNPFARNDLRAVLRELGTRVRA